MNSAFIERGNVVHNKKYDYSKVEYINSHSKVRIICPEHGEFIQLAYVHLNGHGCPECAKKTIGLKKRKCPEDFMTDAKKKYGEFYDYTKVDYEKSNEKVEIVCPIHGSFFVRPNDFLKGHACPKCGYEAVSKALKKDTEYFLKKAKRIHGSRYDYSKVVYDGRDTKVCIICPEHGEFWQVAGDHLMGHGCPECAKKEIAEKQRLSAEDFIKRAKEIHGAKYDYTKVEYINTHTKVKIICPEHGEFWQTPNSHLNGHGCPKCKKWKMESDLIEIFEKLNIKYEFRKRDFSWLRRKKPLELDFYLPAFNVAVECQGIQHFKPVKHYGGETRFIYRSENDKLKAKLCKEHGVKLLYYADYKFDFPVKILNNKEDLLVEIFKNDTHLQSP